MSELARWNSAALSDAITDLLSCCGSRAWAQTLAEERPFGSVSALIARASEVWAALPPEDWQQAFACHPRIGERKATASAKSLEWSETEQSGMDGSEARVVNELAALNLEYERRFGFVFLVCATGKSGAEMLGILKSRLRRTPKEEQREAAVQQQMITEIRLRNWLGND